MVYFYDLNAKANAILSKRDRIYLSGFSSRDKFGGVVEDSDDRIEANLRWHNRLVSLRWNHQFSDRMFANTLLGGTNYEMLNRTYQRDDYDNGRTIFTSKYRSEIVDWIGKVDFEYVHSLRHYVRFGAEGVIHHFNPGTASARFQDFNSKIDASFKSAAGKLRSTEIAAYAEDETRLGSRVRATIGIRFSSYFAEGATYSGIEPRLAANIRLTETMAAKASWAWANQYVHLLTQGAVTLPTDIWVPTLDSVEPQRGYQAALGLVRAFNGNAFELSLETYFKRLNNYLEYEEGSSTFESASLSWTDFIEKGSGDAYGLELFLQKKTGRLTGWAAYTLAKATRTFEKLNRGKPFPDGFDRRHDVAIVGQYNLTRTVLVSANWIYGSGYPVWVPVGRFNARDHLDDGSDYNYSTVVDYGPANSARAPASHRLDVSSQIRFDRSWGGHAVVVGCYNIYARQNPMIVFSEIEGDEVTFKQLSLLRIVPSISYQIRF